MLYKAFPAEFKADVDARTFTGYASTFGNVDEGGDRVLAGAFAKTIRERLPRIKVLWQHSIFDPIGRPMKLEEDGRGLLTESRVSDTVLGRDALTLMNDGVVDQLSIGYDVIKDAWDQESMIRDLVEVKLWEYSPVTFAMNEQATITDVKRMSLDEIEDLARKAAFMQEHGLKAGRVLSKRNLALVKDAYEALGSLLEAAESAEEEPDKQSTQPGDESKTEADPEGRAEPDDTTPAQTADEPFEGLAKAIEELGGWTQEQKLLSELRDFGQSLRTGEGS